MLDKIRRLTRPPAPIEVARCCEESLFNTTDAPCDQLIAPNWAEPDSYVDVFGNEVAVARRQIEFESDPGMQAGKVGQQRTDPVNAQIDRHRHT